MQPQHSKYRGESEPLRRAIASVHCDHRRSYDLPTALHVSFYYIKKYSLIVTLKQRVLE